jgi:hypothetical protein
LFYDLLGGPGGRVEFSATVLVMLLGNISSLSKNPVKLDKIGYDDVLPAFRLLISNKALLVRPPAGGVMCRSVSGCVRNAGVLLPRWHVALLRLFFDVIFHWEIACNTLSFQTTTLLGLVFSLSVSFVNYYAKT